MGKVTGFILIALLSFRAFAIENFEHLNGQNYYQILEVNSGADQKVIRSSYIRLVRLHHPDRNGGDDAKMKQINHVYDILSDASKRKSYDLWLEHNSSGPEFMGEAKTRSQTDGNTKTPPPRKEKSARQSMWDRFATEADETVQAALRDHPQAAFTDLVYQIELKIGYYQKYVFNEAMSNVEIRDAVYQYAFHRVTAYYSKTGMMVFAAALIRTLKMRAQYTSSFGQDAQFHLNQIRHFLHQEISAYINTPWGRQLDPVWQVLDGTTFYPQQQPSNSCETTLTGKFRDQYGREWEVPIKVSIKIGF